jgi:aquaporin related protein
MSINGMNNKDTEAGLAYTEPTSPRDHKQRLDKTFNPRVEITVFIGEFIGTFMFLALAFCGTQIAVNGAGIRDLSSDSAALPDVSKLLYIAFAFGVSLAINVAIFADVSGAKFNPAVSLSPYGCCTTHHQHNPLLIPALCVTTQKHWICSSGSRET